jgi:small subunit ribosomal protein S8
MQNFLGDMRTRIINGHRARLGAVFLHPSTPKIYIKILEILREEGYILGFQHEVNIYNSNKSQLKVILKYDHSGTPIIRSFFQISKPSRPVYLTLNSFWKPKSTFGLFIISTSAGFMIDREARKRNLGGEVLCGIY